MSLVYRLLRCLFGLLAVLVRSDLSKDAELLVVRHENQVLRRQLGGRLRWDHADRVWLAALSRLVSRRRWPQVFSVAPGDVDGTRSAGLLATTVAVAVGAASAHRVRQVPKSRVMPCPTRPRPPSQKTNEPVARVDSLPASST